MDHYDPLQEKDKILVLNKFVFWEAHKLDYNLNTVRI